MNNYLKMLSVAGVACVPQLAAAAGPTLSDVFVNSGISAAGYADASYTSFFQKTHGATSGPILHAFDSNNNTFAVNQAALTLSYLPTSGFGASVNALVGDDAKVINGAYGTGGSDFALTQAFVQYAAGNLTVIGGRFVTLAGAEVIDDTKNANVSRSLLFTTAEPLVHTGLRATYKVNDLLTTTLGVNNTAFGSASLGDQDKHKTAEFGLSITPSSAISISVADYYGLEGSSPSSKLNYLDLVASWQATSALQFVVNGDYVRSIGSAIALPAAFGVAPPGNSTVTGFAAYAVYQINDQWKATLRGENVYYKLQPSGGPNQGLHVSEGTFTVDYSATKNFDLLAEGRIDYGTQPIFVGSTSGSRKSQPEVLLKAIFKFGTPTGS